MIKPRSRTQQQNLVTSYEVAFYHENKQVRLGFTARRTKGGLLAIAQSKATLLMEALSEADLDADARYSKARGWEFGSGRVDFTGKTERQCADQENEDV